MKRSRCLLSALLCLVLVLAGAMLINMTALADGNSYLTDMRGGVANLLDLKTNTSTASKVDTTFGINVDNWSEKKGEQESSLVMANVKKFLYVRTEPDVDAERVGVMYKDDGGMILDKTEGWTKLQSGNIVGWARDEFLYFGEDALSLANDVGKSIATVTVETLRVRTAPGLEEEVIGFLPKGEMVEVSYKTEDEEWLCVNCDGIEGFIKADCVKLDFVIGAGETVEEIKIREEAEREASRHKNYGEYTTDADTRLLLAALIHCEAGGEPYEGQVAVGAVVMNRVRSAAYPNTIHAVIYASGQFTPAMTGWLNRVYESGKIYESCIKAADEALSGVSNVGDLTHFRRVNGRAGLVIGNHVFY